MANNALNISIPMKFEIRAPPRGMTDYDPKALSVDQQEELNTYKYNIRKENVIYLREHPEVNALVSLIIRMTMSNQPRDIIKFVANIFNRPEHKIRQEVDKILNEKKFEYEPIPFSDCEEWEK